MGNSLTSLRQFVHQSLQLGCPLLRRGRLPCGQGTPCPYLRDGGNSLTLVRAGTVTRPYSMAFLLLFIFPACGLGTPCPYLRDGGNSLTLVRAGTVTRPYSMAFLLPLAPAPCSEAIYSPPYKGGAGGGSEWGSYCTLNVTVAGWRSAARAVRVTGPVLWRSCCNTTRHLPKNARRRSALNRSIDV